MVKRDLVALEYNIAVTFLHLAFYSRIWSQIALHMGYLKLWHKYNMFIN